MEAELEFAVSEFCGTEVVPSRKRVTDGSISKPDERCWIRECHRLAGGHPLLSMTSKSDKTRTQRSKKRQS